MENRSTTGVSPKRSMLSVPHTNSPGIVVFSHLRWNFVWQRPQQFLSRFATDHRVLFIEEPVFALDDGNSGRLELEAVHPNVMVATVHLARDHRFHPDLKKTLRSFARQAIDTFKMKGEFDAPLLWYYGPMEAAWSLDHFENCGIVYDCMDELSQFKGAPPELIEQERRLLKKADVVFAGGYELWLKRSRQHPNAHFFGCGVEVEHFGQALDDDTPVPAELRNLPKPVVGWFGVIDERVDYRLLSEMAEIRPDWAFVMVGPLAKVDPADLPQAPNLHWMGARPYADLPSWCKGFDVCMMCFALNEATEYINPTKALEYLATGRPVVSTPVAEVVRHYSDLVDIGRSAQDFVNSIERTLAQPDLDRVNRGLAMAASNSWDNTVAQMRALIAEAIQKRGEIARCD